MATAAPMPTEELPVALPSALAVASLLLLALKVKVPPAVMVPLSGM